MLLQCVQTTTENLHDAGRCFRDQAMIHQEQQRLYQGGVAELTGFRAMGDGSFQRIYLVAFADDP